MKRKTVPVQRNSLIKQVEIVAHLSKTTTGMNIISDHGDKVWTTSKGMRKLGMIICSDCGHVCSDSKEFCPHCLEKLVAIVK